MFLTRFLFLAVGSGILAHWKTFSFTQSIDDNLVSIAGGEKECNVFLVTNIVVARGEWSDELFIKSYCWSPP